MLEIVNGSLDELKAEQKKVINAVQKRISTFKRMVKAKDRSPQQQLTIQKHEAWIRRFKVSEMAPVRVEGIVINYIVYKRLMKKLKGFVMVYWDKYSKGTLELYDLTKQLDGVLGDHLPEAKITR